MNAQHNQRLIINGVLKNAIVILSQISSNIRIIICFLQQGTLHDREHFELSLFSVTLLFVLLIYRE